LPAFVSFGSKTASLANYYRLLIAEILPNNVEKTIDIIINKDNRNCGISALVIIWLIVLISAIIILI
jgi:hypothetical protein